MKIIHEGIKQDGFITEKVSVAVKETIHYTGKCVGSSHCMDYSESYEDYIKLQESRKTVEQIKRDNIDRYKKSLEPKKDKLERLDNFKYMPEVICYSKKIHCYYCRQLL